MYVDQGLHGNAADNLIPHYMSQIIKTSQNHIDIISALTQNQKLQRYSTTCNKVVGKER